MEAVTAEHEAPLRFRARRCPYPYVNEAPLDRDDVYHVWLRFVFDPEWGGMKLERYPEAQYRDNEPAWMEEEELTSLLGVEWHQEVRWMLEEGIAPGQPFLVRIQMPYYSVDYWGEGDVDYRDIKILWRRPLPRACALKRWTHALRRIETWQASFAREHREREHLARINVLRMYVTTYVIPEGSGIEPHTGGRRLSLRSGDHHFLHVSASSGDVPHAAAVDTFVRQVLLRFPHMWEARIRHLVKNARF